jgi:hypothetical protein
LCTATGEDDQKYTCSTTEEEQEVRNQWNDLAGADDSPGDQNATPSPAAQIDPAPSAIGVDVNALFDTMAMPDGAEDAVAAMRQTYLQECEENAVAPGQASISTQTPFGPSRRAVPPAPSLR